MKIIFGITKPNFGGAQRYVLELASEMKNLGHEVKVVCGAPTANNMINLVDKLGAKDIEVITLPRLRRDIFFIDDSLSFLNLLKILKKEKPDVFHVNSSKMGGLGALAGRICGTKKIIFTAHGWEFNGPRSSWQKFFIKIFVWATLMLAHKVICVSEKTKKDVESWPLVRERLTIIHNGIKKFNVKKNRTDSIFTVGTIAELRKIKGLDVLLEAWSKFVKKNNRSRLIIIGNGEEKDNLKKTAERFGILDNVFFTGYLENARDRLSEFDVFVLPSRSEGFPYALLEAGISGLAVIATAVGGVPEIIENGTRGILVPPENSEELFSSLILLAGDEKLRKRLGSSLRLFVEENFSFEKMIDDTLKVYV